MTDYLLPIEPNTSLLWYPILASLPIFAIALYSIYKDVNFGISLSIIGVGMCVLFIPGYLFIFPMDDEYNNQMQTLIETTDCSNLPAIADERKSFKDEIVDEIVLRCLIEQDPILVAWLQGAT